MKRVMVMTRGPPDILRVRFIPNLKFGKIQPSEPVEFVESRINKLGMLPPNFVHREREPD